MSKDDLINIHAVREIAHLSESAVWRQIKRGTFPRPIYLGPKTVRWPRREVEAWFAERLAASGRAAA